jgi:dTDP-4-dehydrorhamnose reductase
VGGYDPRLLRGCPRAHAGPIPPRAGNVSMCSDKLIAALQGNPVRAWPIREELFPTDRLWHFNRSAEEGGSFQRIVEQLYHAGGVVGHASSLPHH